MEPPGLRLRLSLMMFGLYMILGSWAVTLATYLISTPLLGGLAFSAGQVSWIYNCWAFGGMAAPVFLGLLADRLFAVEKLLTVFSVLSGIVLLGVALFLETKQQRVTSAYEDLASTQFIEQRSLLDWRLESIKDPTSIPAGVQAQIADKQDAMLRHPILREEIDSAFYPLMGLMMLYCFCTIMTIGASNVMGFRNLNDPRANYGRIRLFGTVGWILAGLAVAWSGRAISPFPLYFAAALNILMGAYYMTLPHTPPVGKGKTIGEAFGLPALKLFRQKDFRVLIGCLFCMSTIQQFYGVYANKFLNDIQAPMPTAMQTLGQVSEVLCMAILPWFVDRVGLKATMLIGLAGWTLRNLLFATNVMPVVCFLGLPIHGMSFTLFFVVAMIYVDRKAPQELRASTQAIFTFTSSGMGVFTGNMLAALVVKHHTLGGVIDWAPVWLVPAGMAACVFLYFAWRFHPQPEAHLIPEEIPEPGHNLEELAV